jgi:nitroreductase
LNIITKREVRDYDGRSIPEDVLRFIVEAGRLSGSSSNEQEWLFYVVQDKDVLRQVSVAASRPIMADAGAVIVFVSTGSDGLDMGRAAQNVMLAAWAYGVGSCPNGFADEDAIKRILGIADEHEISIIVSLGYSKSNAGPKSDDPDAIIARAKRKPLAEVTRWV